MSPADIEAARVKARRRMIGMAVLVGAGVIGFPWLFETQPRPLPSDITVVNASSPPAVVPPAKAPERPSAPSVPPATLPAVVADAVDAAQASGSASEREPRNEGASAPSVPAEREQEESSPDSREVFEPDSPPVARTAAVSPKDQAASRAEAKARLDAKLRAQAETKARLEAKAKLEAKLKAEAKAKADAKAKAEALAKASAKPSPSGAQAKADPKGSASKPVAKADAKPAAKPVEAKAPSAPADTRYIVQIGAFGDANAAQETRMKVERLGIKTYTHEIGAGSTRKIRVRVGPYASKADADKAMTTLRKAGLSGALLTL